MPVTPSETSLEIAYAWRASQGRRARQEDHCAIWRDDENEASNAPTVDPRQVSLQASEDGSRLAVEGNNYQAASSTLVVLADGMGGHTSGQIASRAVCDGYIRAFATLEGDVGPRMARALADANASLTELIAADPMLAGMGSTLVAAHVGSDGLRWVSVGDSTLLLYRDGVLQRLNADHSHGAILDQQAAAGIISEEIARTDTRRRALHSAITGDPIPLQDLELQGFELMAGDWVVIASDGLLTLDGDEIATLIHDHATSTPPELVSALLAAVEAKREPNQDNSTIAALRITNRARDVDTTEAPTARPGEPLAAAAAGVDLDGRTITHAVKSPRSEPPRSQPPSQPRSQPRSEPQARPSRADHQTSGPATSATTSPTEDNDRSTLGIVLGLLVVAAIAVIGWLFLAPLVTG
ncbi:MAG: protein phosphatase 2C domain-containing protein [Hyphomicrobiaceae bacterium]|nr:protein phosphatase 2C domain-containing protein [Hyphomicrobiaceae bacterium]